jgi:hypothetical protein
MRPLALLLVLVAAPARAEYPWLTHAAAVDGELAARFAPPPGAERVPLAPGSFGDWLRHLPLRPPSEPVRLYNGDKKARQDVHAAVVDLDVGTRDLQQCADAVMRLRAEYLYSLDRPVRFHPEPGKPRELAWSGGRDRARFQKFLTRLFADAGSASLAAELPTVSGRAPAPGDVLIQGGYPGHAILILDAAVGADGRRWLLLGQSYMPAQDFHVLKNFGDPARSPWYDAAALDGAGGLRTPEWPRPFFARDLRRFD